jgi:hypothetical protein
VVDFGIVDVTVAHLQHFIQTPHHSERRLAGGSTASSNKCGRRTWDMVKPAAALRRGGGERDGSSSRRSGANAAGLLRYDQLLKGCLKVKSAATQVSLRA